MKVNGCGPAADTNFRGYKTSAASCYHADLTFERIGYRQELRLKPPEPTAKSANPLLVCISILRIERDEFVVPKVSELWDGSFRELPMFRAPNCDRRTKQQPST